MKEKINKTNVARLLDKAKIAYQLVPYEVDENDLRARGRYRPSIQDLDLAWR